MHIDYEDTFKTALSQGINLFLGAGFSLLATNADGKSLPLGSLLQRELVEEFNMAKFRDLPLPQLCTLLVAENKEQFYSFLRYRFSVSEFDTRYYALEKINVRTLFTTNIDDLLYKIYAHSVKHYLNNVVHRGVVLGDKTGIDLVTLHGSIVYEGEDLEFSTLELAASFSSDPDKWHVLTERLQQKATLFWGYSLQDSGVLQALSSDTVRGRPHQNKWIVLRDKDEAAIGYFRTLGFHIIEGETSDVLDYLMKLELDSDSISFSDNSAYTLFREASIPAPGNVPVRPLDEFYLGASPTWYDIFSNQLHRTRYFTEVVNMIHGGKNTVVVGIPASGKTTLMMQVAAHMNFTGHKFVFNNSMISVEKVYMLLNELSTNNAIVFVDDFADSIEAFDILLKARNILAVGFDRDYMFDMAQHKISPNDYTIIGVTELNNYDIQQIYSRMPPRIKRANYIAPTLEEGMLPSLYEVIESNVIEQTLMQRFKSMLIDLEVKEPKLQELLVMFCYVHSCRVPVSYDMVSAFLRDYVKGYTNVQKTVKKLGAIVSSYGGNLVGNPDNDYSDQDYFIPRSTIISETVLKIVSAKVYRNMLERFHEQVSPFRISNFETFKRTAFDKHHIKKAFSNWKEGMAFYEKLYLRDRSPYLRQQGALYLAEKNRFKEAFNWIDEALTEAPNIISIRNSHAIILFDANIHMQETDGVVRQTLERSMTILANCYNYDKRKAYHALRFADQALRFAEVFNDEKAIDYLRTANKWLSDEEKRSPWNQSVKRLHSKIAIALSKY